jgi:uncharacterized membrane protein
VIDTEKIYHRVIAYLTSVLYAICIMRYWKMLYDN